MTATRSAGCCSRRRQFVDEIKGLGKTADFDDDVRLAAFFALERIKRDAGCEDNENNYQGGNDQNVDTWRFPYFRIGLRRGVTFYNSCILKRAEKSQRSIQVLMGGCGFPGRGGARMVFPVH
ncbi:MAG: hypothetical protein R2860_02535 [Desulfobacterales bacterium]